MMNRCVTVLIPLLVLIPMLVLDATNGLVGLQSAS